MRPWSLPARTRLLPREVALSGRGCADVLGALTAPMLDVESMQAIRETSESLCARVRFLVQCRLIIEKGSPSLWRVPAERKEFCDLDRVSHSAFTQLIAISGGQQLLRPQYFTDASVSKQR